MKLVGRYLSPFARRVGIALHLLEIDFEHDPVSIVDDRAAVNKISSLSRIPCLVLDDGEVLVDSHQILAELDRMVGPERAMVPRDSANLRAYGQMIATTTGSLEKFVAMMYELSRRPQEKVWKPWADQCRAQVLGGLAEAESRADARVAEDGYLFGDRPTHADVSAVLAFQMGRGAAKQEVTSDSHPRLGGLAGRFGAHPVFALTSPVGP